MPKCNGKSRGYDIRHNNPRITLPKRHLLVESDPGKPWRVACGTKDFRWVAENNRRDRVNCQRCLLLMETGRV